MLPKGTAGRKKGSQCRWADGRSPSLIQLNRTTHRKLICSKSVSSVWDLVDKQCHTAVFLNLHDFSGLKTVVRQTKKCCDKWGSPAWDKYLWSCGVLQWQESEVKGEKKAYRVLLSWSWFTCFYYFLGMRNLYTNHISVLLTCLWCPHPDRHGEDQRQQHTTETYMATPTTTCSRPEDLWTLQVLHQLKS